MRTFQTAFAGLVGFILGVGYSSRAPQTTLPPETAPIEAPVLDTAEADDLRDSVAMAAAPAVRPAQIAPVPPKAVPRKRVTRRKSRPSKRRRSRAPRGPDGSWLQLYSSAKSDLSQEKASVPSFGVSGIAYDLRTASGAQGLELLFQDSKTGETFRTLTDQKGRYRLALPVSPLGYRIALLESGDSIRFFHTDRAWLLALTPSRREELLKKRLSAPPRDLVVEGTAGISLRRDLAVVLP